MSGLENKYFVLKPKSKTRLDPYARASRIAMKSYAYAIRAVNIQLSDELLEWVSDEEKQEKKLEE